VTSSPANLDVCTCNVLHTWEHEANHRKTDVTAQLANQRTPVSKNLCTEYSFVLTKLILSRRLQFSPSPCHLEAPALTKFLSPGGSSSHQLPATWRLQFPPRGVPTNSLPPGGSSSHQEEFPPSPCHLRLQFSQVLEGPVLQLVTLGRWARYGVRPDAWLARGSSGAWLSSHACITGTVPCLDCLYRSSALHWVVFAALESGLDR